MVVETDVGRTWPERQKFGDINTVEAAASSSLLHNEAVQPRKSSASRAAVRLAAVETYSTQKRCGTSSSTRNRVTMLRNHALRPA
jgi:hypothetical protein